MDNIKELLEKRIEEDLKELENLSITDEARAQAVQDLVQLYKLRIEETKHENEIQEKREARIMELDEKREMKSREQTAAEQIEREKLAEQVKDRYFRVAMTGAEIVLPLVFYAKWMKQGFKFEETGAYTSTTFRGLINRFKPTRK